jgi:hypothetical protein
MSANRSVQAAQRRRAGPTNAEPNIPGRGPQPSINSSQMFASQGRQQSGLKQQQQQQQQQQQPGKPEGLSSVSKMTLPQAITLITLRLGAVESKLMNLQQDSGFTGATQMDGQEDMVLIDKNVIQSITSRLESLEKRTSSASGVSGPEMNLLKQQVDTVKQAVIKSNSVSANLVKENKDVKSQMHNLQGELSETKELLHAIQNLTMDNSQKLLNLSMNMSNDDMLLQEEEVGTTQILVTDVLTDVLTNDKSEISEINEIVKGNLKEMIENEINATI